jgi:hypothetical protein
MSQTRAMSTIVVADAANGADGITGLMLTYGRYPDCPRSRPPLAAEDNRNPKCAEGGLCPAQPASECAGALWPARPVDADLQKIGCASSPLRSVGHDLADNGRHGIVVDDILDRGAPVAFEAGRRRVSSIGMGGHRPGSH